MKHILFFSSIILFGILISSCCSARKAKDLKSGQASYVTGPQVIIYQTTKDYSNLVPIILSEDKKSVVSYPDVRDVYYNGNLAYPTQLHKGYWLDNRGINRNAAFIKLTYEEYSKLTTPPSAEELMNMIIENEPVISMYSCGIRSAYKDIEKELNTKIDNDNFSTFKKIK